jgi:putative transferase (TIGR04331 family)
MNNARICVATYNATFFLESMTRNVPTCMFWNPVYWELNENAAPYYNLLRQASLLFDDPVSCASHISSIWGDVENWWRSSLVQKAVDEFLNEFALVGKKPIRKLKRALTNWEF